MSCCQNRKHYAEDIVGEWTMEFHDINIELSVSQINQIVSVWFFENTCINKINKCMKLFQRKLFVYAY